uniref:immunoglobulin superfamily member 3 isoform X1 n=1 Tax=Geotrypetes seraphini TaxID=260995 RepID=UPI0014583906|nr:immunoglobulin superfamily member 3 isoform X1 [Geotrypetes seraphini]XP_033798239.1 immunoglobulin superfamily member 3 isoform X1 [Geotrypetes seraphini]XP_033798240.1 immunoglobulin superfamily member 3 isoform X1 [Geotrypetes seraphini]XP_033798241.1 immunoglobulin superfamily member 3 isoform X1 [Geotrypetes seraphini]XP_033798242.1 immunoglobulin superfamily member 3 isoform X1 [Geotrypetes seraphini]
MRCCALALLFLLLLGIASAQRVVTVQNGLLYRTEGSHITIWCKVSGYQGPSEQNFRWSIYLPSAPKREVQIVSTGEPNFSYAVYSQRVQSGEIYVERIKGDYVLLHITNLQDRDTGEYECHTPNTDERYFGSYSAKMNLTVITDTLRVTSLPQTVNKVEGDTLELKCEVSENTAQHTHLSVSWYRQKGTQVTEVISLNRNFVLHSGSTYAQRQASGDVRLDKIGEASFKLTVYNLQASDQGEFYCEAAEWVQDPDETWFSMTKKRSDGTVINVQAADKDFNVRLETEKRAYTVGELMELKCIIDAQNVPDRYFSVSWAFNSSLIASLSPNVVPTLSSEFAQRDARGQLKVAKDSDNIFVLKIFRLRLEDSGKYNCRVTEREKSVTGEFIDKESKRPKNIPITVLPLKSSIGVEVTSNSTVLEGESLRFSCSVRSLAGPQSRLSVTWQLLDRQNQRSDVIWLDRDGTLQPGPSYRERNRFGGVQMEQMQPDLFTLELFSSQKSDEGQYECRVVEWTHNLDGEWQIIGEKSAHATVFVTALDTGFAVTAISRTPGVIYNDSFDLQCILKPHYPSWVPVSVTWRFQLAGSAEFHDLVTFTRDGGIQWGDRYANFRTRTAIEKAESSNNVRLSISRASDSEAGKYQCVAELWRKNYNNSWNRLTERTSNLLEIRVQRPVTKLQVSKSKRSVTVVENGAIPLSCQVKAQTSQDSHFTVLWYVHRSSDADGKLILKTAPNAAFEFGTYAEEEGLRGRLQFERSPAGLFNLTVQKAGVGDSGSYYCHVEEWLLSPNSAWYKLAEEVSGLTEVTVKEPDANLQVSQLQKNITILENEWIAIDCSITNRTSTDSQVSVEWYVWKSGHSEKQHILHHKRDGALHYGYEEEGNMEEHKLPHHLQLEIPSPGLYRLLIQSAEVQDSGAYDCRVQEWLLNSQNKWYKHAEDVSGLTRVTVLQPEAALRLDLTALNVTVPEKGHFQLDCNVLSRSSPVSRFSLTWFMLRTKSGVAGDRNSEVEKEPVFSIGHDSVFEPEPVRWDGRLRFKRVSAVLFRLSIQEASAADAGNYSCRVEEWLPNPRGLWYRLTEEESGLTIVNVQLAGSTLQSVICSNDALFYFVFFYPFPIFGILIICILLVRFKTRQSNKNSEGKNGVPLLWIKEPHLNYSPTCLEPPVLSIHPGTID